MGVASKFGCIGVIAVFLLAIGALIGKGPFGFLNRDRADLQLVYSENFVPMVRPTGNGQVDAQHALNNLTNAQANDLNAQAYARLLEENRLYMLQASQADLNYAEACATRNDCGLQNYMAGQEAGKKSSTTNTLLFIAFLLGSFVVLKVLTGG